MNDISDDEIDAAFARLQAFMDDPNPNPNPNPYPNPNTNPNPTPTPDPDPNPNPNGCRPSWTTTRTRAGT